MNKEIFSEKEWSEKIKDPQWYFEIPALIKSMSVLHDEDKRAYEKVRDCVYDFFEKKLNSNEVALGKTGKNFDAERKAIDTIVIHHTHGDKPITKERLDAIELVRLYATSFANPTDNDKEIKGEPIYSGHFRGERQVFYPYHWIIRKDGNAEQLLFDNETGWHAGNWDINCRSVAIAFDGDFENGEPSEIEIRAVAKLIKDKYSHINKENILGHCEINSKTTCPSKKFLQNGDGDGWKRRLINYI